MENNRNEYSHTFDNAWDKLKDQEIDQVMALSEAYKNFLDEGKTERRCVSRIIADATEQGFKPLAHYLEKGSVGPGDKVYVVSHGKAAVLFVMGQEALENGMRIVGSHLDSPRLDLKPFPLYEDSGVSLLKTHYYGGIKKYLWASIPLALYGTVVLSNGEQVDIAIGDAEDDPILFIPDLLIHLWKDQATKKMTEGISAEDLNVVIGHIPLRNSEAKDKIKDSVLEILHKNYGMVEKDFISAEFEIVPAGKARDVGLDRGMIAGYGHDDRVCAFASMASLFKVEAPQHTAVALFTDKEEVGNHGNTGAESVFFDNAVAELIQLQKGTYNELLLRRSFANSRVLSADITAAFDPTYASAYDKRNAAFVGKGAVLIKYTGSRGKYDCNDANAEYVGWLRKVLDDAGIVWQAGQMGKVDQGGGGTVAYVLANKGAQVVDFGLGALNVHGPHELVSKVDLYMMEKGYEAFYRVNV